MQIVIAIIATIRPLAYLKNAVSFHISYPLFSPYLLNTHKITCPNQLFYQNKEYNYQCLLNFEHYY